MAVSSRSVRSEGKAARCSAALTEQGQTTTGMRLLLKSPQHANIQIATPNTFCQARSAGSRVSYIMVDMRLVIQDYRRRLQGHGGVIFETKKVESEAVDR